MQGAYVDINDPTEVIGTYDGFYCRDCEEECSVVERDIEAKDIE